MPDPLKISAPDIRHDSGGVTVSFEIGTAPIYYRITTPGFEPQKLGEALVSTALFFAMAGGHDLESELPLAEDFLTGSRDIQMIFNRWFPQLKKIAIRAPRRQRPDQKPTPPWQTPKNGAAVLFSGGVDSFHTALEFQDKIQSGIYIHGFDTKIEDASYRAKISEHLQAAAGALGMRLIEVETNLRDYSDDVLFWGNYHFSMIAAVCQMLSADFDRVYIPSSYTYDQLRPWGSHLLTDPLWGTGDLIFVHHGSGCSRVEKIAAIADSEIAQKHLRVCWDNIDEAYNCGECEKCIRTMINLSIFGKLDDFQHLFRKPPHIPDLLPLVCTDKPEQLQFLRNNIREGKRFGAEPELIAQLEEINTQAASYFMTKKVARHSGIRDGNYFCSSAWRDHLLPKIRNQLFDEQCGADPEWLAEKLVASLGRDEIFDLLWRHDRKHLKKSGR